MRHFYVVDRSVVAVVQLVLMLSLSSLLYPCCIPAAQEIVPVALTPEESANEEPVPEQNDSESAAPGPCMPTPGQLERATPDLGAAPFQPPVFRASSLSTLSTARGGLSRTSGGAQH